MRSPFLTYKFPRGIAKSLNCSFCSRNYYDKFVAKREEFVGKVCSSLKFIRRINFKIVYISIEISRGSRFEKR